MNRSTLLILAAFLLPLFSLAQPESYTEKEISLNTGEGTLKGTLTLPASAGASTDFTLIIAGSGPTDRNGNNPVGKNNSLRMLAHFLADQGVASIRYDKRGIAESNDFDIQEEDLRFDHLVEDAVRWVDYARDSGDYRRIIIAGHSEGSLVGMIAADRAEADAFISLAGAGRAADVILKEQLAGQPDMIKDPCYAILDSLKAGQTVEEVPVMIRSLFRASVQPYLISWMAYDPAVEIDRLEIPVLILQGLNDTQVKETDAQLLSEARPDAQVALLPDVTHALKIADNTPAASNRTLSQPALPLAESVKEAINTFLSDME